MMRKWNHIVMAGQEHRIDPPVVLHVRRSEIPMHRPTDIYLRDGLRASCNVADLVRDGWHMAAMRLAPHFLVAREATVQFLDPGRDGSMAWWHRPKRKEQAGVGQIGVDAMRRPGACRTVVIQSRMRDEETRPVLDRQLETALVIIRACVRRFGRVRIAAEDIWRPQDLAARLAGEDRVEWWTVEDWQREFGFAPDSPYVCGGDEEFRGARLVEKKKRRDRLVGARRLAERGRRRAAALSCPEGASPASEDG